MHREQCVASRAVFATLVARPASNDLGNNFKQLAPATGLHSGTRLLEGFKRHSQEPPSDLFSSLKCFRLGSCLKWPVPMRKWSSVVRKSRARVRLYPSS